MRTRMLVGRLERVDLETPSLLPGWSRLAIVCHLRYDAEALRQMTIDAMAGRPASYYPEGRALQRPGTLEPRPGESPADVLASLREASAALDATWSAVEHWPLNVHEPADNVDLGTVRLLDLPMFRLTEVEVHGTDLDVGLPDWSEVFVHAALPFRVQWLESRRPASRAPSPRGRVSWLLRPSDGPAHLVTLDDDVVKTEPADAATKADASIEGTSRDLLALMLGRPARHRLRTRGRVEIATSFSRLFPGP